MSVAEFVFYLLGALAIASAVLVVASRNPVASLLFLVLCFFSVAGLFVTLEAHFLAAIQILVYAGAILVLFLFVIMLLNLGTTELWPRVSRPAGLALATSAGAAFVALLMLTFAGEHAEVDDQAASAAESASIEVVRDDREALRAAADGGGLLDRAAKQRGEGVGTRDLATDEIGSDRDVPPGAGRRTIGLTEEIGAAMFRDFLLPFEVTSLLLLVAMVGAVMLGKRQR